MRKIGDHKRIKRERLPFDKPETNGRKALIARLDKAFGEYVKLCGNYRCQIAPHPPRCTDVMQPNHLITRSVYGLRWDEDNVHGQCRKCNRFLHGNLLGYREGLLKKIGAKRLERLEIRRHNESKMGRFEIETLIKKYK